MPITRHSIYFSTMQLFLSPIKFLGELFSDSVLKVEKKTTAHLRQIPTNSETKQPTLIGESTGCLWGVKEMEYIKVEGAWTKFSTLKLKVMGDISTPTHWRLLMVFRVFSLTVCLSLGGVVSSGWLVQCLMLSTLVVSVFHDICL